MEGAAVAAVLDFLAQEAMVVGPGRPTVASVAYDLPVPSSGLGLHGRGIAMDTDVLAPLAEVRVHGGKLKAVLREIVRRRVGADVAFREKQGFTVPVERWLAERWSGMLERLRHGTALERDGWVRTGSLAAPLGDALRQRWVPVQLWRLLVLEHWLEKNQARAREDQGRAACRLPG